MSVILPVYYQPQYSLSVGERKKNTTKYTGDQGGKLPLDLLQMRKLDRQRHALLVLCIIFSALLHGASAVGGWSRQSESDSFLHSHYFEPTSQIGSGVLDSNSFSIKSRNSGLSIEVWVRPNALLPPSPGAPASVLIRTGEDPPSVDIVSSVTPYNASNSFWYSLSIDPYSLILNTTVRAKVLNSSNLAPVAVSAGVNSIQPLPRGYWTHVAAIFRRGTSSGSSQINLYFNGSLENTVSVPEWDASTTALVVSTGSFLTLIRGGSSTYRNLLVDEFRIRPVALSSDTIASAYCQRLSSSTNGKFSAYWDFDAINIPTSLVPDRSGSNNHLFGMEDASDIRAPIDAPFCVSSTVDAAVVILQVLIGVVILIGIVALVWVTCLLPQIRSGRISKPRAIFAPKR